MSREDRVGLFHIGPQKSATTWVYRCLEEHPGVCCAPSDAVHFFDIHYARGEGWYEEHFRHARQGQLLFDATPSYIRSPGAPRRIARYNPDARLMLCLRHPVDRAWSHYWHERKKRRFDYHFEEVLENYDLFASWVEPGFYAEHIRRCLDHFPREQLLMLRFEELERNPRRFLGRILTFAGVDRDVEPSVLHRRVNPARGAETGRYRAWEGLKAAGRRLGLGRLLGWLGVKREVGRMERSGTFDRWVRDREEYERGMAPALREELLALCEPEVRRLEEMLDVDLDAWRR